MINDAFFIAEVGSTWHSIDDKQAFKNCIISCDRAAEANADAIKFQLFSNKELYGYPGSKLDDRYALPRKFVPIIKEHCDAIGIEFMCSAFSLGGFKFIDQYVNIHKVASSKVTDRIFMECMFDRQQDEKLILISSGMAWLDFSHITEKKNYNIVPMMCASAYPALPEQYDMREIAAYDGMKYGLSDHTITTALAKIIRAHGGGFFEKHVDFVGCSEENPDAKVSIKPKSFAAYINQVKKVKNNLPDETRKNARDIWGDRWNKDLNGYFRPAKC